LDLNKVSWRNTFSTVTRKIFSTRGTNRERRRHIVLTQSRRARPSPERMRETSGRRMAFGERSTVHYGPPGQKYTCWTVLEHRPSNTGIAYCEEGFGPSFPWGLIFLSGPHMNIGMDAGWKHSGGFRHFHGQRFSHACWNCSPGALRNHIRM
jgi:hypothetical protein